MASFSKQAALFLLAALLLCVLCTRGQAARPTPGSSHHKSQVDTISCLSQHMDMHFKFLFSRLVYRVAIVGFVNLLVIL